MRRAKNRSTKEDNSTLPLYELLLFGSELKSNWNLKKVQKKFKKQVKKYNFYI